MPGLVGVAGNISHIEATTLTENMAHHLETASRFTTQLYAEDGLGFGRVGLEIVNPTQQPIWNTSQDIAIVMEGELYDTDATRQRLAAKGFSFSSEADAELLLHLYEECPDSFAIEVNGAFCAAIWDKRYRRLLLVNDRLGQYPLYYATLDGYLIFSSGIRALLADPTLPRSLDYTGIAQFLAFDHLLNEHTFLTDVHLFPQATLMTWDEGGLRMQAYWTPRTPQFYELRSEGDYIEEFNSLLKQAVARQAHKGQDLGILLSGGIDSRYILPFLLEYVDVDRLHAFTWGTPGCDDIQFAQEISHLMKVQHHYFELKPDWLLDKGVEALRLTDGMGNIVNLHAIATLDAETQYAPIIYKGFLGDAMMGYGQRQQHWATYDAATMLPAHLQVHKDQHVITFDQAEQQQLFSDDFQEKIQNSVWDEYISGMYASGADSLADQRLIFDYKQRVPRMTINGVEVVRSQAHVRLPFCDNDLVEYSLRLPPGLRYHRRVMKNAFIRHFPELAQVPITEDGLPMMSCARDVRIRFERLMRWHLSKRGLLPKQLSKKQHYADYNLWFRTNLKTWVEDTLLGPRALQRGFYRPEYLNKIIAEHMNGANYAVRIGALMTVELWLREFID